MTGDLFGREPPIVWDSAGFKGVARDGRPVAITVSPLTTRYIATLPLHGRDLATRRSERTVEDVRTAIERAVEAS